MQNFLDFVSFGLLQLATTNRGSRPEIQDDPGVGGREARDDDLDTTNKGLDSMSNDEPPSRSFPQRDGNIEERNHQGIKRKNDNGKR